MGQPGIPNRMSSPAEFIGGWKRTQGSETSQYLKEEKSSQRFPQERRANGEQPKPSLETEPGLWGCFRVYPG